MGDWTDPARPWTGPEHLEAAKNASPAPNQWLPVGPQPAIWHPTTPFEAVDPSRDLGNGDNSLKTTVIDSAGHPHIFVGIVTAAVRHSGVLELERNGDWFGSFAPGGWICVLKG